MSDPTTSPAELPAHPKRIGWNGRSLHSMLEESDRWFEDTGAYWGIEDLTLKERDPIRYERICSRAGKTRRR
jgi:hypothetical protein